MTYFTKERRKENISTPKALWRVWSRGMRGDLGWKLVSGIWAVAMNLPIPSPGQRWAANTTGKMGWNRLWSWPLVLLFKSPPGRIAGFVLLKQRPPKGTESHRPWPSTKELKPGETCWEQAFLGFTQTWSFSNKWTGPPSQGWPSGLDLYICKDICNSDKSRSIIR